MSKREYLNSIKTLNNKKVLELELTIKSIGEAIAQSNKDIDSYNMQQLDCEKQIDQFGIDNIMLDEIIAIIPDNS